MLTKTNHGQYSLSEIEKPPETRVIKQMERIYK